MDKTSIFNMALDVFGMEPVTADDIQKNEAREVKILSIHYNQAIQRVSLENRWSFLDDVIEISAPNTTVLCSTTTNEVFNRTSLVMSQDLGAKADYLHSFKLPEGILRITKIESGYLRSRRVGEFLLTDCENPIVYAQIVNNIVPENKAIPDTFWALAALSLSFLSSASISNTEPKAIQMIASEYNSLLKSAMFTDLSQNVALVEQ